jgi:hypothetical protein
MNDAPEDDDLRDHYDFDYRQAKPNRFAAALRAGRSPVSLEPEVASQCLTSGDANRAIKSLLDTTMLPSDTMRETTRVLTESISIGTRNFQIYESKHSDN